MDPIYIRDTVIADNDITADYFVKCDTVPVCRYHYRNLCNRPCFVDFESIEQNVLFKIALRSFDSIITDIL